MSVSLSLFVCFFPILFVSKAGFILHIYSFILLKVTSQQFTKFIKVSKSRILSTSYYSLKDVKIFVHIMTKILHSRNEFWLKLC